MTKPGGFWDKANRKLVGDEKMDLLNAKAAARNESLDKKVGKFTAKLQASVEKDKIELATRKAEKIRMKESKKEIEEGLYSDISGSDLYDATLIAAGVLKYSIVSSDKAGYIVTFQTPKVETFWDGKLSCFVLGIGPNAKVTVSGSPNKGSTTAALSPGQGGGVMDFLGEQASTGSFVGELGKFKKEIWRQVQIYPKNTPLAVHPSTASDSLPAQLERLKQLFENGALTQEEYGKAKAKLLG